MVAIAHKMVNLMRMSDLWMCWITEVSLNIRTYIHYRGTWVSCTSVHDVEYTVKNMAAHTYIRTDHT